MPGCQYCGGMHPPLYACEARRKAEQTIANKPVVTILSAMWLRTEDDTQTGT